MESGAISKRQLKNRVEKYRAGNIKNFIDVWKKFTSDKFIIDTVSHGLRLNFEEVPVQIGPRNYPKTVTDEVILRDELDKLIRKGVVVPTNWQKGDVFSNIFLVPKADESYRFVLNLKNLNSYTSTKHFKMESIRNVLAMMKQGCWMASVDLKDAYFSVPIHDDHTHFLKFVFGEEYFKFVAMPNGYNDAMRVFTKILKPPFFFLRSKGHLSVVYVDDSYLQGDDYNECKQNLLDTIMLLQDLGFTIHSEKSILDPCQEMVFLGFIVNSILMRISLTQKKKQKIKNLAARLMDNKDNITIRLLAKFIGNVTASFEAVPLGPLHYREMEGDKVKALARTRGDYEGKMWLSDESIQEVMWWHDNIMSSYRNVVPVDITHTIYTDASDIGWGAVMDGKMAHGLWSDNEITHINIQEILAVYKALCCLLPRGARHVRIMSDNQTAISYINKMGGTVSKECNDIAKVIWEWCNNRGCWISAAYIPGKDNYVADWQSRDFTESAEWMISDYAFAYICQWYSISPEIDLFSSPHNKRLDRFVSWKPCKEATHIDAFSISWNYAVTYSFPPFSLVWKVLQKFRREGNIMLLVAPLWPTQSWFPEIMRYLVSTPISFCSRHLSLPGEGIKHPLYPKLKLGAFLLSNDPYKRNEFLAKQKPSSWRHGEDLLNKDMNQYSSDGNNFVTKGRLISFAQMPNTL